MKRTLEQLVLSFNEIEQQKRDAEISKVLENHIRPHVLNLENWSIDDINKIRCAPILIDKPQGMGERYQVYNRAWELMAHELHCGGGYTISWGGSSWDICPNIRYEPGSFEKSSKSARTGESAETIFKKTWERLGTDFLEVVKKEADRLVAFLSSSDNWVPETRTSKPFEWNDPLKYTRYKSYAEVKRIAILQLGTEKLTLDFRDTGINKTEAKIVAVKKRGGDADSNDDSDI